MAGYSWAPSYEEVPRLPGDERALLDDVEAQSGIPIRTLGPGEPGAWFWEMDPLRYPDTDHLREVRSLEQARRDGVRVLLSGWGGDELASFNGRTAIRHLLRGGRPLAAWRGCSQALALQKDGPVAFGKRARTFARELVSVLPDPLRSRIHRRRRSGQDQRLLELEACVREFSPLAADIREQNIKAYASMSDHHEMQLSMLQFGHLQRRTSGWHQTGHLMGVQYRYPLLDLEVVETALRLPWWAFLSNGWPRAAFRLAMEPYLPASVTWNVAKREPALYRPSGGSIEIVEHSRRWRHLDDPHYEAVMRLAMATRDTGVRPAPTNLPVVARPDLALRV